MRKTPSCASLPSPPFAATIVAVTAALLAHGLPAHAREPSGFGHSHTSVDEDPELDCSSYAADSSPSGWACDTWPDARGDVVSTRKDRECYPTEITLNYYYVTASGIQKTLPRALVYHCHNGQVHGIFDKKWVRYDPSTDKAAPLRESGEYVAGMQAGT